MNFFRLVAWIVACGFAIPASAQPSDAELRRQAEQILSSEEFQHFDHFERKPKLPEATGNHEKPGDKSEAADKPWWERLRNRREKKTDSMNSSEKSKGTAHPQSEHQTTAETPKSPSKSESPAQRTSDGIQRPVRHAPKAPRESPEWNFHLPEWLLALLEPLGNLLGLTLHGIAYLVLAAVVALIVALAARALGAAWQNRRRGGSAGTQWLSPLAHDRSPGETAADVFLQQALAFAAQGAYREALGQLVLGAMSCIEHHEWIRYRRGLTLHDYLRSVRNRPEQHASLRQVIEVYEPAEYGRMPVTQVEFESALAGYRVGFETVQS